MYFFGERTLKTLISLIFFINFFFSQLSIAAFSDAGTEFWFCFNQNYLNTPEDRESLQLKAIVVPLHDTKITLTEFRTGTVKEYIVKKDSLLVIELDKENQITKYEEPVKNSFRLKSEKPVVVWATSEIPNSADSYTVLPIEMLGKDYNIISYYNRVAFLLFGQMTVLATEDDTEVTIIPSTFTGGGKPMFRPLEIKLNQGETYSIFSVTPTQEMEGLPQQELSGTVIKSNKNIAVFAGHQCGFVPRETQACDYLIEQIPPIKFWGNEYFLGGIQKRTKFTYRILTLENGTDIRKNSKWVGNINAFQVFEDEIKGDFLHIETSSPTLLMQFSHGYMDIDSIGDPTMMLVRPVSHYQKKYTIATPFDKQWLHFVNIYIPTASIEKLQWNGKKVDKSIFKEVPNTKYSVGSLQLNYGVHHLECDVPFGITSYGHSNKKDDFSSYGHR